QRPDRREPRPGRGTAETARHRPETGPAHPGRAGEGTIQSRGRTAARKRHRAEDTGQAAAICDSGRLREFTAEGAEGAERKRRMYTVYILLSLSAPSAPSAVNTIESPYGREVSISQRLRARWRSAAGDREARRRLPRGPRPPGPPRRHRHR